MDFDRDTRALTLKSVGGWMRIMGQLHFAPTRGKKRHSLSSWANVMGCSIKEVETIVNELRAHKVGKFRYSSGQLTIESRRMRVEEEQREKDNLRVRQFRMRSK